MQTIGIVVGVALLVSVIADLVNTLVATRTNRRRFWLASEG